MKVFDPEFPLTAEFRSGPRGMKKSYEDWLDQQMMPEGYPVDLQTNVLRFEPLNWKYANRFAAEHPETMVLSTWRAASGTPKGAIDDGDPLGVSTITFPGHFVLSPGTTLSSSISSSAQTLLVTSTTNMRKGPALLVETTSSGDKIWDRYEYVLITGVGADSTISVRRQFNGSPDARPFPSGRTYVAPMPWDSRNRKPYTDWFFNLSRFCPKDQNGRTAMDVIAIDMIEPLREGGPLDLIAGIDLASGPLTVNPSNADYNLDGIADSDEIYRDGVKTFYQRIREVLGPDRVLTTSLDYEYVSEGFINGVNQEGLAQPDDPWEDLTETVNEVLAWRKLSNLPMVSLAFTQHMSREEDLLRVNMQRLLNGYSVCLGLAADIETGSGSDTLDAIKRIELYNGDRKEPHWLGRKLSMRRTALLSSNLLNNARSASDWDRIIPALSVKRGTLAIDGDELVLTPNKGNFSGYVTLNLNFQLTTQTDFTVYLEAISDDNQIQRKILLPRINMQADSKALRAKLTSKDYLPLTFYVRGAERSSSATIDFRFEHGGPIRFRQIGIHAATDSLACEFENGVVLTNPSLSDQAYDLTELFPGRSNFRRIAASSPVGDVPEKYRPQLRQALELNNGQLITNTRSVVVPERNAIFLNADSVRSNGAVEVNGFELLPVTSNSDYGNKEKRPTRSPTRRNPPTRAPTYSDISVERPALDSPDEKPASDDGQKPVPLVIVGNNLPQLLDLCEGDCDTDDDCRGSLICHQRNKRSPSFVLGCDGFAKKGTDFCVDPAVLNSNRIVDGHTGTGHNIFDQDVWSSLPLDQEIDLESAVPTGDSLPKPSGIPTESSAGPGRKPNNSSSGSLIGTSKSTMGTELAIGIVAAMLSIGLFLAHRRKNKSKKEFFVEVGDGSVAGDAPPEKPAKTDMASPPPRSICTVETERAAGGRDIIPVAEVTDENNSFGPMYEV